MKKSKAITLFLVISISTSIFAHTNLFLFNNYTNILPYINTVKDIKKIDKFINSNQNICNKKVYDNYSLEFLLKFKCLKVLKSNNYDPIQLYKLSEKCINLIPEKKVNEKNEFLYKIHSILADLYLQENWLDEANKEIEFAEFYIKEKTPLFHALKGMFYYKKGNYQNATKHLKKACSKKVFTLKYAYVCYADICFNQQDYSKGFELLNNSFQIFGVDNVNPEKDIAVNLFFNKINYAEKLDVELFYDGLGGVIDTAKFNKSNAELIAFLINQRAFLSSQFSFITKEDDLNFYMKYL